LSDQQQAFYFSNAVSVVQRHKNGFLRLEAGVKVDIDQQ